MNNRRDCQKSKTFMISQFHEKYIVKSHKKFIRRLSASYYALD